LAFGPGYDARGDLDFSQCRGAIWTSGENLRNAASLKKELLPGGNLRVDGAMAQPSALLHDENSPPWISYSTDFNREYPKQALFGQIGDVAVLGCDGAQLAADLHGKGGGGDHGGGHCSGPSCVVLACLLDPSKCLPEPKACAQSAVSLHCDPKTGEYVAEVTAKSLVKASLQGLKLTDPSGKIAGLPQDLAPADKASVPLRGLAPGQVGQINLCQYDAKTAADGLPHDCCNTTVTFKIPAKACVKEIQ
jgi:hypothetical protein